ncbi:hypothetical protein PR202_ga13134 [Eleusine coracana subsp. coracana]|uniref:Pre-mRNA processing factor 4 (PRP4)-like domain-containing protein n=1 Tax=Eleusine coracana subsp. coracana TaxID=191504 RepID=A0AAV5CDW0_ELECO|nr:hypothetical protein PR202_ga13134 [Eleusine coracana subsp. coracana]
MDVLKRELQRKRQLLDADFGGRKIFRRAEIEAREIQRIREAERQRLLQKQLRASADSHRASSPSGSSSGSSPTSAAGADASRVEDGPNDATASLPREEVIRRLRLLRQPATLFGEDDAARLRRLQEVLEDPVALANVDAEEIGEGQTNDFLRDIQALRVKAAAAVKPKPGSEAQRKEGDGEQRDVPFEELCDEDKIAAFFRRLMGEWSQELDQMPEAERRTAKGKAAVATCKQCARYLEPLFKQCKKKALSHEVRQALLEVVKCCLRRDYLAAVDNYIKLAIGNSPWPIGVTMARKYPTDPSRSVEFNSLANGSDLQSLLAEQNAKNSEETLRLVAAS